MASCRKSSSDSTSKRGESWSGSRNDTIARNTTRESKMKRMIEEGGGEICRKYWSYVHPMFPAPHASMAQPNNNQNGRLNPCPRRLARKHMTAASAALKFCRVSETRKPAGVPWRVAAVNKCKTRTDPARTISLRGMRQALVAHSLIQFDADPLTSRGVPRFGQISSSLE